MVAIKDGLRDMENLMNLLKIEHSKLLEKKQKTKLPAQNPFVESMETFFTESKTIHEALVDRFKKSEDNYNAVVTLYGEDPKIMFPEEFFGIFWAFGNGYAISKVENEEALAKEREAEKRDAEKKDREEKRRKNNAAKEDKNLARSKQPVNNVNKGEGGLDDLISAIRTGKAFGGGDNGRRRERNANNPKVKIEDVGKKQEKDQPLKSKKTVISSMLAPDSNESKRASRRLSVVHNDNDGEPRAPRRLSVVQVDGVLDNKRASRRLSVAYNDTVADSNRASRRLSVSYNDSGAESNRTSRRRSIVVNDGSPVGRSSTRRMSVAMSDRPSITLAHASSFQSDSPSLSTRGRRLSMSQRPSDLGRRGTAGEQDVPQSFTKADLSSSLTRPSSLLRDNSSGVPNRFFTIDN